MQERLTFGSLAEKGSFFLNAGNAPSSYAGMALSSNARKASSSYAGKAHFLNAERLTFSVVWLGKAQFLSIEKAHLQKGLMQEKLYILSSRGPILSVIYLERR